MTNAVGGFEWPGSSMNELKLIYIPSLEDTFIYNTETASACGVQFYYERRATMLIQNNNNTAATVQHRNIN